MTFSKTVLVTLAVVFVTGCTDPKSRLSPDGLLPPGTKEQQKKDQLEDLVQPDEALELSYPLKSTRLNRVEVESAARYKRIVKRFTFQAEQSGFLSLGEARSEINNCETKGRALEVALALSQGNTLIEEEGPSPIEAGRVYVVTVTINNDLKCDNISYGFSVVFEQ